MDIKERIEQCTNAEDLNNICGEILELQEIIEESKVLVRNKMAIVNPDEFERGNLSHLFLEYSIFSQLSKNKLT